MNFGSVERRNLYYLIIVGIFFLYALRLFYMQIINQELFDERASSNSIKKSQLTPLRGVFYDRNMKLVVENIPAYSVSVTPVKYDTTINKYLERALYVNRGHIHTAIQRKKSSYIPLVVKRGVSFESIGWINENMEHLDGVSYNIDLQRGYPGGIRGSHIFGYNREITQNLLSKDDFYQQGDLVGYSGLERKYEKLLRGEKGYAFIVYDSKGREIGKFHDGANDIPSNKGKDLVLTIDSDVQYLAEQELKGWNGAVVAIEPSTGEILALASAPDYDLGQFSNITSKEFLQQLKNDPNVPEYNRATMSMYPPGSTFKVLCAIAALDMGVIDENTTEFCGGGFTFGRFFKCHGAHGSINVVHAIERSCNTFFYKLIFKIGLDNLAEYAHRFGLGQKTGVDLHEEAPGLIATSKLLEQKHGKDWPRGILVSLGIGQAETLVTPLQLAHYTALVANDGVSYTPHLVKGYLDENKELVPFEFDRVETGVKKEVLDIAKRGMFLVVNGPGGTARGSKIYGIEYAGKTGTAQNSHGKDHALFIAFAPFENPVIAIAVVVENSGFGSTYAAPIAKRIIEGYLMKFPEYEQKIQYTYKPPVKKQDLEIAD